MSDGHEGLDETRRVCLIALTKDRAGENCAESLATAVHALYFHHGLLTADEAVELLDVGDVLERTLSERSALRLKLAVNEISELLSQPLLFLFPAEDQDTDRLP